MTRTFEELDVYKALFSKPIAIDYLNSIGVDSSGCIAALRAEGANVFEKDGFVYWDQTGFGSISISARYNCPVYFASHCHSTNDWARQIIEDTGQKEFLVVCKDQLAGRGRLGREWKSNAEDSLICSLVCTPKIDVEHVSVCSLVWMADIAHKLGLFVKWPNDLMSSVGKKIGGCLTELVDNQPTLIFGVGINVGHKVAPLHTASSLILEGIPLLREEVLSIIMDCVFSHRNDFSLDRWKTCALYMGQNIRVRDIEGTMTGIRDDGALLVDGEPVLTGDVELVEDRRCSW